jgi:hypothetical protein
VCYFEQKRTANERIFSNIKPPSEGGSSPKTSVQRRGAMNDMRRYRVYAVECLSAAKNCQPGYRDLFLSISACWYLLARQDEAVKTLLESWTDLQIPELEAMAGLHHVKKTGAERVQLSARTHSGHARDFSKSL